MGGWSFGPEPGGGERDHDRSGLRSRFQESGRDWRGGHWLLVCRDLTSPSGMLCSTRGFCLFLFQLWGPGPRAQGGGVAVDTSGLELGMSLRVLEMGTLASGGQRTEAMMVETSRLGYQDPAVTLGG